MLTLAPGMTLRSLPPSTSLASSVLKPHQRSLAQRRKGLASSSPRKLCLLSLAYS